MGERAHEPETAERQEAGRREERHDFVEQAAGRRQQPQRLPDVDERDERDEGAGQVTGGGRHVGSVAEAAAPVGRRGQPGVDELDGQDRSERQLPRGHSE